MQCLRSKLARRTSAMLLTAYQPAIGDKLVEYVNCVFGTIATVQCDNGLLRMSELTTSRIYDIVDDMDLGLLRRRFNLLREATPRQSEHSRSPPNVRRDYRV